MIYCSGEAERVRQALRLWEAQGSGKQHTLPKSRIWPWPDQLGCLALQHTLKSWALNKCKCQNYFQNLQSHKKKIIKKKNHHFLPLQNHLEREQTVQLLVHNYAMPSSPFSTPSWAWILGYCCQRCLPAPLGSAHHTGLPHQQEILVLCVSCLVADKKLAVMLITSGLTQLHKRWQGCLPALQMMEVHDLLDDRIKITKS